MYVSFIAENCCDLDIPIAIVASTTIQANGDRQPYMQVFKSAGLMIALDIYLRLDCEEEARGVLERVCDRFTFTEQAEMLGSSRALWKKMLSGLEKPILELLQIHPAKLRSAVSRSVSLLEQRLKIGPSRPFRDKTLEELVHLVSTNTFNNCPYDVLEGYGPPRQRPLVESGLLRKPCTKRQIAQLESRLEVSLPQDYKDFLSITNGMDPIWDGKNLLSIFVSAEKVDFMDSDHLTGCTLNLTREYDPLSRSGNQLSWPEVAGGLTQEGVAVSGTGTNGDLWLVKPELTKQCKDYFFETYEGRSTEQKKELARVVRETYGSMKAFASLEWGLISWTSWGIEIIPYSGMRDVFERLAEQSMRVSRVWDHVFEPDFRISSDVG